MGIHFAIFRKYSNRGAVFRIYFWQWAKSEPDWSVRNRKISGAEYLPNSSARTEFTCAATTFLPHPPARFIGTRLMALF